MKDLITKAEALIFLHNCEQEGIESGMPTKEQWYSAVNELSAEIQRVKSIPTTGYSNLIEKIKALKVRDRMMRSLVYNGAINDVLNLLESLPEPIRAKAFYQYESFTNIEVNNADLPETFRLKDIEIYVKNKIK